MTEYFDLAWSHERAAVNIVHAFPIGCDYDRAGQPYIIFKGIDEDAQRWTFKAIGYVPASDEYFCVAFAPIRPRFRVGDHVYMFREAYADGRYASYGRRVGTVTHVDRRDLSWKRYEPTWIRVAYEDGTYAYFKPTELEPAYKYVGAYAG